MVSVEKISRKLIQLDEYLAVLGKISATSGDVFVKDKILLGSAKYYLQVSIETCLDVANHIIAAERFRAPKDYADTFTVLEENHVLEKSFAQKLRQMAKFRNRLVHLYGEIDDAFVYEFLQNDIEDFRLFRKIVMQRMMVDNH
jgi:uncharacterized protein YutE (UPF0331/DUF86 family)